MVVMVVVVVVVAMANRGTLLMQISWSPSPRAVQHRQSSSFEGEQPEYVPRSKCTSIAKNQGRKGLIDHRFNEKMVN